ncbi:MAG: hypothetical protein MI725_18380 [Pirellulales bacterium]|nr:hypothetical protein [Pirellulales bacterium]
MNELFRNSLCVLRCALVSKRLSAAAPVRITLLGFFALACCLNGMSPAQADGVEEFFQELFLGESVYPQEAGELQFTTGFFWAEQGADDFRIPVVLEYGLTDWFQVGVEMPVDFLRTGSNSGEGLGNVELEAYWSVVNDPESGWAGGVGLGLGLPTATSGVGEDALIYEPFFVLYKTWDTLAVNFSAALEIEDPREAGEDTEVEAELALALIKPLEQLPLICLFEVGAEIEEDETAVRLAPGVYWQPRGAEWELGVSLPAGVTDAAVDFGAFVFFTREFGGSEEETDEDG